LHLLTRREPWSFMQDPDFASVNVSEPMRAFLKKLVASDPRDRFPGASAALEALDRAARGEMPVAPPAKLATRRPWWRPTLLAAAAVGVGPLGSPEPAAVVEPVPLPTVRAAVPVVTVTPPPVVLPTPESLPAGKPIDLKVDQASESDVLRAVGSACGLNVVIPDAVRFDTTVELQAVPCDQALEVLLESRGLWYTYRSAGNLLRVAPRKQLDMEMHAALERKRVRAQLGLEDDPLPEGKAIDIELERAPIGDVLEVLADAGGVNVVLADSIGGSVTLIAKSVGWRDALRVVLEAQSLGYRYRENGKLLMVAPQRDLDMEDHATLERKRIMTPEK